jgi:phosphomannomutase
MISVAGIRGIVGDSLLPEEFLRYVLAFATTLDGGPVVVGGDSRVSREMMRHLAFAGLASCGSTIHDIGLVPTPTVGLMIRELGAAGGIAITASHNPAEWNAYKFFDANGSFLNKGQNARLLEVARTGEFRRAGFRELGKVLPRTDAIERHLARVYAAIDTRAIRARRFKVVVDCCNGVGGLIMEPLLKELGCDAELFDIDVNAEFPRNPEPLPENLGKLSDRVRARKADIGFAVDPDVDRLAIVDDTGRPIGEERTVVLASASALTRAKGPLVVNLSTTRAMDDVAARFGVPLHRTPIGEANVIAKMREVDALIGGEGNGGVIYPAIHGGRDAATGVGLILGAMAAAGKPISALNAEVPDYAMVKTKYDLGAMDPARIAEKMRGAFADAKELATEDGVKAVYGDRWVHVRPSGTEPVLRAFAEAPTVKAADELLQVVKQKVLA